MNEVRFKVWRIEEAERLGISVGGVTRRYYRGYYAGKLKVRRHNARIVFITPLAPCPDSSGEVQFLVWRENEARRHGMKVSAFTARFYRGQFHDGFTFRSVNKRVVLVRPNPPASLPLPANQSAS